MSLTIKEVRTKSDLKKFVRFGTDLYKGNQYFCPPLEFDELNTLNKAKNPAFEVCEAIYYIAERDGKIIGRIAGIINHRANEQWNVKKCRFGWFDFVDDLEVSAALLNKVVEWGRTKNMTCINGPVGFTDLDREGLLIEGYEYNSPMASLYNYPYYIKHFDNYGLVKEMDWIEYRIHPPKEIPERLDRISKIVMKKYGLRVEKVRSAKELLSKFGYTFFDVVDEAYKPLYNYSPLTEKQKIYYSKMYFPLVNYDFATIVANEKDEIVGVGVGMPDISDALRVCQGKLFPFGWIKVLKALKAKKMDDFDLLIIAVRPDYQNKGVNAIFFHDQIKYFVKYGVKRAETTSILETNAKNQANWEYFDKIQHKRRRAYLKQLAISN
ncbi:MAG: N-acetyltransferase [Prevotellaceae bacterium]|jgi:GNAT superfamily N-acetyltransferase|nr:N-acetyltransferase [Prevotellaceae bacterium]